MGCIMDFLENFIYYLIDNTMEIVKVIIILVTFFGMKTSFTRKEIFLNSIFLVIFSFFWCFKTKSPIFILLYVLFIMLEIYILYNGYENRKLFLKELWSILFINIIDAMVYNSVSTFFKYCNFNSVVFNKIIAYIIVLIFLFIINRFIKNKIQFIHKISTMYYMLYILSGIADYLFLSYVFIIIRGMKKGAIIVSLIVSISILLQYSLILFMTLANEGLRFQHYLNKKYLRVQQENYEYLEYREEETKRFRHDYKNHLNSLQILCKEKRYEDVENYINEISERLKQHNVYFSVCNSFVDAILNYYYQKMRKIHIKFKISGKMPRICNINLFDLCTIVSNLLDNAIEAVEKLNEDKRFIEMTFRYDNLMIYCNVLNPYSGELDIYKNKIISKKNSKNHGYGLSNVRKSVDIYNGSLDIKTSDCIFEVLIALVNKEK